MPQGTHVGYVCPDKRVVAGKVTGFEISASVRNNVRCGPHSIDNAVGTCSVICCWSVGGVVAIKNEIPHIVAGK